MKITEGDIRIPCVAVEKWQCTNFTTETQRDPKQEQRRMGFSLSVRRNFSKHAIINLESPLASELELPSHVFPELPLSQK